MSEREPAQPRPEGADAHSPSPTETGDAWWGRVLRASRNRWLPQSALVDQGIVSLASIATVVILSRTAGNVELGLYSLGMSAVLIGVNVHESLVAAPYMVFTNLRNLSETGLHRYTGTVVVQTGMLGAVLAILLAVGGLSAGIIGLPVAPGVALALAAAVPLVLLRELARRCCLARFQTPLLLAIDVAAVVTQVGLLLWAGLAGKLDAATAFGILGLSSALAFMGWLIVVRRTMSFRVAAVWRNTIRSWRFGKWVLWCSVATVLTGYSVHWILAIGIGAAASGLFEAVRTLANLVNPAISGLRNYVGPASARSRQRNGAASVRRKVAKTTLLIGGIGLAWLAIVFFLGDTMLTMLYGSEFAQYDHVLLATAAAFVAFGLGVPADQGLWALERPELSAYAATAGLVTTVALAVALGADPFMAALALLAGKLLELGVRADAFARLSRGSTPSGEGPG